MNGDDHKSRKRPRRWVARLTLLGFVLFTLGLAGVIQLSAWVTTIRAELPVTPVLAEVPVSVAVTDRNGALLRPFTTGDGRWRLPVRKA